MTSLRLAVPAASRVHADAASLRGTRSTSRRSAPFWACAASRSKATARSAAGKAQLACGRMLTSLLRKMGAASVASAPAGVADLDDPGAQTSYFDRMGDDRPPD